MNEPGLEDIVKTEKSILSAINRLYIQHGFPSSLVQELHSFADGYDEVQPVLPQLNDIMEMTSCIAIALLSDVSLPISDPKLISLLRQHAVLSQELGMAEAASSSRIKTLRAHNGIDYGEDVPPSFVRIDEWFTAQLESWAKDAGMQVYTDRETQDKITLILSGKILVLDIEITVQYTPKIILEMISLKSTQAFPFDAAAVTAPSLPKAGSSIDDYMLNTFREYLCEIQKDPGSIRADRTAKLCRSLKRDLHHLMKLDNLASRTHEGGSRWFTEVDDISAVTRQLASKEATAVARDLQVEIAPLDILLIRGHALPLPYLRILASSFLVYIPPSCYLALSRACTGEANTLKIDIPLNVLESYLTKDDLPKGCVLADLCMQPSSQPGYTAEMIGGPQFPLVSSEETLGETDFDHILPIDSGSDAWVIDFGPGVVMSQSRMWELQVVLKHTPDTHALPMISLGHTGSWVDLLIQDPKELIPHQYYTSIYTSPAGSHPPLHLTLDVPQEPGFILRKIRVQSMHQVWRIFEIVRDQSWYNNLIRSCQWKPEDSDENTPYPNPQNHSSDVPRRIPVAIYFEATPPPLFDPTLHREHPSVIMVFLRRSPETPVGTVSARLDNSAPRGVRVTVNGSTNGYSDIRKLEEMVRRGGIFGLPGQLWKDN